LADVASPAKVARIIQLTEKTGYLLLSQEPTEKNLKVYPRAKKQAAETLWPQLIFAAHFSQKPSSTFLM